LFVKFFNNIIQTKFYLGVQPEVLEAIELPMLGGPSNGFILCWVVLQMASSTAFDSHAEKIGTRLHSRIQEVTSG
jgi:hypothetical protein